MKTIEEIRQITTKEFEMQRIEKMIRSHFGSLAFISIHESEAFSVEELIKEFESATYVIYIKKEDHIVIDLIESAEKQYMESK